MSAKPKKPARKPLTKAQREAKNAALRAARAKKKKPLKLFGTTSKKEAVAAAKPILFEMGKPKAGKSRYIEIPPVVKKRIKQNGFTRPAPVTKKGKPLITFRVWQIADEISARNAVEAKKTDATAKPATRQQVLNQAVTIEKIPYATFSNNFYRWRRFNGLNGRIKLDGTPSKPYAPKNGKSNNNAAVARLTGKPSTLTGKPAVTPVALA